MRRGVTLLELLLALGLMVLVSVLLFSFYDQVLRTREVAQQAVSSGYLARMIAHQIADEIRAANGFVSTIGPGITGKERVLTIQTVALPDKKLFKKYGIDDKLPPAECDVRLVQYYLGYDKDDENYVYADGSTGMAPLGLVRREVKTHFQSALMEKDEKSVHLDLVSPELKYVRFRYYDGVDWVDRWDIGIEPEGKMGNSLPQAVEVTVGYSEAPPPKVEEEEEELDESELLPSEPELYSRDAYTVMVRLPQADTFFGSRLMRAQQITRNRASSSSGGGSEAR
ncbi:MAG TPA: hypothetical protein VNT79_02590 [Phycisphaerae bacterium]|nr:hypothetical protein [Phycisphaerae bacterium]